MRQRELVRCDGQKHVNECQDSRMMQKYQVSLHRYVKLTQNKSSQDENKRLESRDNLHRANCCLPPKFLLLSRPAPICKPIHFHLYRNLYFINNNPLDMVLYYFFLFKNDLPCIYLEKYLHGSFFIYYFIKLHFKCTCYIKKHTTLLLDIIDHSLFYVLLLPQQGIFLEISQV